MNDNEFRCMSCNGVFEGDPVMVPKGDEKHGYCKQCAVFRNGRVESFPADDEAFSCIVLPPSKTGWVIEYKGKDLVLTVCPSD